MMVGDADGSRLRKLHDVMDGKKGKSVALFLYAAVKIGWLELPTYTQVSSEFGDIGSQQNFARYMDGLRFLNSEIEGAINSLT